MRSRLMRYLLTPVLICFLCIQTQVAQAVDLGMSFEDFCDVYNQCVLHIDDKNKESMYIHLHNAQQNLHTKTITANEQTAFAYTFYLDQNTDKIQTIIVKCAANGTIFSTSYVLEALYDTFFPNKYPDAKTAVDVPDEDRRSYLQRNRCRSEVKHIEPAFPGASANVPAVMVDGILFSYIEIGDYRLYTVTTPPTYSINDAS